MAYFGFLADICSGFYLSMLNYIDMYVHIDVTIRQ